MKNNSRRSSVKGPNAYHGPEEKSIFDRARGLLIKGDGNRKTRATARASKSSGEQTVQASTRQPASTQQPASGLLARFGGLQGSAKLAFFRANAGALKSEAKAVEAAAAAEAKKARQLAAEKVAADGSPAGLLARFRLLSGGARIAFFRANKVALKAAESQELAGVTADADHGGGESDSAALLAAAEALPFAQRLIYFRENRAELRAAAVIVAAENRRAA